jgi:glutamine synthetase type III
MNNEDITINLINNERIIFEIDKINKIEELFNKLFFQIEELKKDNELLKKKLEETKRDLEREKINRLYDR